MDRVDLVKELRFESAHRLPRVPEGHKCARVHGHSFKAEIALRGPIDEEMGWFIDFGEVDTVLGDLYEALDHRYLNDIEGLENPTSENIARWIWRRVEGWLPGLTSVTVYETCDARCVYRGPD